MITQQNGKEEQKENKGHNSINNYLEKMKIFWVSLSWYMVSAETRQGIKAYNSQYACFYCTWDINQRQSSRSEIYISKHPSSKLLLNYLSQNPKLSQNYFDYGLIYSTWPLQKWFFATPASFFLYHFCQMNDSFHLQGSSHNLHIIGPLLPELTELLLCSQI